MDVRIKIVTLLMKKGVNCKLSINEIARFVNLSPSRLRHLFKKETGEALHAYQHKLSLQYAAHLLTTTFLSVKEISAKIGMNDYSHFVREFEKYYGVSPKQYRIRFLDPAKYF